MSKIKDVILDTHLDNTNMYGQYGNSTYETTDKVFIADKNDYTNRYDTPILIDPTDYALMNGASILEDDKKRSGYIFLRNVEETFRISYVHTNGVYSRESVSAHSFCIRPMLNMAIPSFLSYGNNYDFLKIYFL